MSSFGGAMGGVGGSMGGMGQAMGALGAAANSFNTANQGNTGVSLPAGQKGAVGGDNGFKDIEALLDRYMAKQQAVNDAANGVGTKINY